jgi:hypothetical protein
MKNAQARYTSQTGWKNLPEQNEIWNSERTLIFIFSSPCFINDPAPFQLLKNMFPLARIVGCSTAGEIQDANLSDDSVVAHLSYFESSHFKIEYEKITSPIESFRIGQELANRISTDCSDMRGAFIFADGLKTNGTKFIEGVNSVLIQKDIPIGGGLAGDGKNFNNTFLIIDNKILLQHILIIGFFGSDLQIAAAAHGGWDIFGPERTITKSRGNILYEIDGKPALDLYKEYLGTKASELPASGLLFPLHIYPIDNPSKKLIRTILAIDEIEKSLVFAGDIPENYTAQLMCAHIDRVIDGASVATQKAQAKVSQKTDQDPQLVLVVSCVGRRLVLGSSAAEELEAVKADLPIKSSIIGFYSYGEFAPVMDSTTCDLHNQSMTLFILNEKNNPTLRQVI